jgi:hypothetical protein
MNVRTQEDGFEYQAKEIFEEMEQDYKDEQEQRKEDGEDIQTFAEWLWKNTDDLGKIFYDRFDQWCGIDESTEEFNVA